MYIYIYTYVVYYSLLNIGAFQKCRIQTCPKTADKRKTRTPVGAQFPFGRLRSLSRP